MSFKVTDFGTNRKIIYDFLSQINTNYLLSCTVSEIQRSIGLNSLYLAIPLTLCLLHRQRFPWDDISVKFSVDVNGWSRYQMA